MGYKSKKNGGKGRSGGDGRGSSSARRLRKLWLLGAISDPTLGMAPYGGDGQTVICVHCDKKLDFDTVTSDRIVPGARGGTYERKNVQPACLSCNMKRSANPDWRHGSRS